MQNKEIAHIDLKYLKYQKTYHIENNLVNDLELFETQNSSNKPVVNYLFNPTNELGKSLNQWDYTLILTQLIQKIIIISINWKKIIKLSMIW